jgi:hypothetical protein
MKNKFQIIFPSSETDKNEIHPIFSADAKVMEEIGLFVGTIPSKKAIKLMYKGFCMYNEKDYPNDKRFINSFEGNVNCNYLSIYYPLIADISIETFFIDELDETVPELIKQKGWSKAFIKKDVRALENIEEGKSVWPNTSIDEMKMLYDEMKIQGKYCIRKFIAPEILEQEERYWVLNGNIYHRHNKVPAVVKEAASRLNKLGSKYYTVDATPDFVVEVNPGESSDRHAVNSAELFASWIKKEFAD